MVQVFQPAGLCQYGRKQCRGRVASYSSILIYIPLMARCMSMTDTLQLESLVAVQPQRHKASLNASKMQSNVWALHIGRQRWLILSVMAVVPT